MAKRNMDIVPFKRRHKGVSRTALIQQDWKFLIKNIAQKSYRDRLLRQLRIKRTK